MLAFAGNSILNRFAVVDGGAGAWSFTLIRLVCGALTLALLARYRLGQKSWRPQHGSWIGALCLLVYAASFSSAYLALDAGLGALILFASVQFTMMSRGLIAGESFSPRQWIGAAAALGAVVWLLWPDEASAMQAVPLWAAAAMGTSGFAWGLYSLIGRKTAAPLLATSGNFTRAALIAVIISVPVLLFWPETPPARSAALAAAASGAVTSGLGYAIWYTVLPAYSRLQAGVMQLSVPAIAAIGGVIFLGEVLTPRLVISAAVILVGVSAAAQRHSPDEPKP